MRFFLLLALVAVSLTACTYRYVPRDVTGFYEEKIPFETQKKMATIVVDAGHGGKDTGAANKKNAYEEKSLTLSTALLIKNYLTKLGYKAVLTRSQDTFVPLTARAEIANSLAADLFVSIHYNFSENPEAEGIEVYYYKEEKSSKSPRILQSRLLAQNVLTRVITRTGAESRGLKTANFAVIRETKMPAILVEGGFLSNPSERERLRDPKYLRHIAWGIAKGVDEYLHRKKV